jgi:uncharacterized MAPEG superfamily protein
MNDPSPIDHMKSYKGGSYPHPMIPLSGLLIGYLLPNVVILPYLPTSWSSLSPQDSLLILLQSLLFMSFLFTAEFFIGATSRGLSTKAAFSPAAVQALGITPFAAIQANRILQNHMESACAYLPAAVAATAAGANVRVVVATSITWVVARVLYRLGYCNETNPIWRASGVTAAQVQTWTCWYLFVKTKM